MKKTSAARVCLSKTAIVSVGFTTALATCSTFGFSVQTGNPDLRIFWDNTVRLNAGWRLEDIDDAIGDNPQFDESDYKFKQGDMVTQRIDLLTEFDLIWKGAYGFRISAAGWYDHAYHDVDVKQNPELKASGLPSSYYGDTYSSRTKNYHRGPYGEILDAFVFASHTFGEVPVSVKAGQHTIFWGMAVLYAGGIAAHQHPLDGHKAQANPGAEIKELFLPLNQVSLQAQLTPTVGLEAQYYLDWDNFRAPEGGTFLAGADPILDGPDRAGIPPFAEFPRLKALEPKNDHGNWGVALKFAPEILQGQTIGVYYREFDEKTPSLTAAPDLSGYRAVYADGASLAGISFDGNLGSLALGAELGYHWDTSILTAPFSFTNNWAQGDTWHALVNTIYLLPTTFLWDTGSLVTELTYDRLDKITDHRELYSGVGTDACKINPLSPPGSGKVKDGCATKDAWGLNVIFTPQWLAAYPNLDISAPVILRAGLHGNSSPSLGVNEGSYVLSVGVNFKYREIHQLSVAYDDSWAQQHKENGVLVGGNGQGYGLTDRGRVTITYKVSF